jgi:hypothetical protein
MIFHPYSFYIENFLFASRLRFPIPVIHSSRTHLSYSTFVMLTVLCINITCLKRLITVWAHKSVYDSTADTTNNWKGFRDKGMYCKHYICLTNLSSPNNFKLSSLVVGSNIYLEKGLFKYQLECCFIGGPHRSLECCFVGGPHVKPAFMNWINLIMCMKDQQMHVDFIGVFFRSMVTKVFRPLMWPSAGWFIW